MSLYKENKYYPTSAYLVYLFIAAYKKHLTGLNNTIQCSSTEIAKRDNNQHICLLVSHLWNITPYLN